MIAFGPVPSRRLGMSLGVNNIPYKVCTYSCVYCQLGRTLKMDVERREFYPPEEIRREVEGKLHSEVDYITFVPDGEPTLDVNLGREADILRDFGYPIAVITNSSLLWREDVREDLMHFDFVSLKVDAVTPEIWRRVDRPHPSLNLDGIMDGILEFRDGFKGKLVTETMLIGGVDYGGEIERLAEFVERIEPDIAYIAIPTRPPAEPWVKPPDDELLAKTYHIFSERVGRVEYLIGYEGNSFEISGNLREDVLGITSVHPLRREALEKMVKDAGESWELVEDMLRDGEIRETRYRGHIYYIRNFRRRGENESKNT